MIIIFKMVLFSPIISFIYLNLTNSKIFNNSLCLDVQIMVFKRKILFYFYL